jgi:hypothetical protein
LSGAATIRLNKHATPLRSPHAAASTECEVGTHIPSARKLPAPE